MQAAIITDLDGTLIDHDTYSAADAADTVRKAQGAGVPICICSSKTRKEIIHYRSALRIADPFISENGGAIFIPNGYFEGQVKAGFELIELGTPYIALVAALRQARRELGIRLRGFHEITPEELAKKTSLTAEMAEMALERECDEPFWLEDDSGALDSIAQFLRKRSLHVTRGSRFHHVTGNNDKGKAVELLSGRYKYHLGDVVFAGLGDSPNDIPMLSRVDIPILVKSHSGDYDEETRRALPGVRLADGIGPRGWSAAVTALLAEWRQ